MVKTKLEMDFLDDQNKNYRISINEPRADITDMEVFAVMDTLLGAGIFQSRNGDLVEKVGARVVTTTVDEMTV
ncbi:DUF2922 domain-containing protein [Gudongella sp. SC589]|jgi:hypothetical protein|uniref:DUF2922 domain-containing protein n=1 Tax=Gudongella sp. SC589 TaxID=3385990 RepID=UPI003904D257